MINVIVCPFACRFSTNEGDSLRRHVVQRHSRPVPAELAWWPEFSAVEFVRLQAWRTMLLAGWACADESKVRVEVAL